jgi:hypothetical protein
MGCGFGHGEMISKATIRKYKKARSVMCKGLHGAWDCRVFCQEAPSQPGV